MKIFCFFITIFAVLTVNARQNLVLIGGGHRPQQAMSEFVHFAGGIHAHILIITWATNYPEESYTGLVEDFKLAGATNFEASLVGPKDLASKLKFLKQLALADGVFFSGGDQSDIMIPLKDKLLLKAIQTKYQAGYVFGGTSAGTAVMSLPMMTGDTTPVTKGLGLLKGSLLDTHFLVRNRNARLAAALAQFPGLLGVGVDEGTSLIVKDGAHAQVVGPGQVVMVRLNFNPSEDYLQPGDCYHILNQSRESCE